MATKGLMISERPPPSVMSGSSSSMAVGGGGGGGAPSSVPGVKIGNYKGVMLCNRPFAGVAASSKAAQKGGPAPFVTGIPTEKIGGSIPITAKTRKHVRSKKHTALSRHKKWLAELQATKDKLEAEMIDDEQKKEERKLRFMERERQMRQAVRGLDVEDEEDDGDAEAEAKGAADGLAERKPQTDADPDEKPSARDEAPPARAAPKVQGKGKAGDSEGSKPMWAMTEEEAEEAAEEKENEEAERLLDFAANLDFDKYIDDMEVRAMMEQVKNTVDDLESAIAEEEAAEEAKAADAEAKAEAGEGEGAAAGAKLTAENVRQLGGEGNDAEGGGAGSGGGGADDDARSVATSILSHASSLRAVHSKKSMAALAEQARSRMQKQDTIVEEQEQPAAPPLRVVVHNEEPTRLTKALDPSNLPYMHRNPAV